MKRVLSTILCVALLFSSIVTLAPQNASAATTQAEYVGNVKLAGDPSFDSDSIANSDTDQWRWLSYPESRIVVNPGNRPKYDGGMNLNIGLFVNGVQKVSSLQKLQMAETGQSAHDATSITTAWYPYKLTANASYGADGTLDMSEFFVDKNTFVRYINASGVNGKVMTMSASISGVSVLPDHSILVDADGYYFLYKVMLLNDDSSVKQIIAPTISGSVWTAQIPFTTDTAKVAFSLTLAAKVDDSTTGTVVNRSSAATSGKILDKLAATKTYWDGKLAKVPQPTVWGIQSGVNSQGVTPTQHRRSFYAAWTFKYQNILEPTLEKDYPYYQVTLGKASLWPHGSTKAPNSCSWESMFDIQQLSMVEPDIAWNAAKGFINSIGDDGILDGECLPSQKAHMVWVCYEHKKANDLLNGKSIDGLDTELSALYTKVKSYLKWRFNNPRWIYAGHNYADEKDISFVTQWYSDVNYAIKICNVIGNSADVGMWENMKQEMGNNARTWFFTPDAGDSTDKIYNSYFTDHQTHYYGDRTQDVPNYIYSALFADLPTDLTQKLVTSYLNFQDASKPLVGYDFYKYGDGCHTAYGLLEKSTQYPELQGKYEEFINSVLASTIKNVEYSEGLKNNNGTIQIDGVIPSSFGTSSVIDFTYMNNGMRIDFGAPAVISDGNTGLQKASNSDVTLYTVVKTPAALPKTVSAKDKNGAAVNAYVAWESVSDSQYAQSGSFTVKGKMADTGIEVTATVYVYGGNVTLTPVSVETFRNVIPTLPTSVVVAYQQNSTAQSSAVNITWDEMKESDFSAVGTVKVGGTIDFNGQRVEADVKVTVAPVIESATGKDTVAQYQTLQLSAKDSDGNALPVTWGIQDAGDDAVANINQNGLLQAVKPGTVTVTALTQNGLGTIKKEITITAQNVVSFAYGGTATASNSMDSARSPAQAIDEDVISMWRAANNDDSQWFQLQMKQSVPITGVKILWFEGDQPQAFVLKTSENGSDWKTVYTRTAKIDTGKTDYSEIITLNQAENAKYVRMESSKAGNYAMGIKEFQVFGAPQITNPIQDVSITSQTGAFEIVNKGVTLQLGATVTPDTASDARVEWTVTNTDGTDTDKATISPSGVVTPLKDGTVKVTAAAVDGSAVTASQTITISNQDLINVALNKPATATTNGGSSNLPSAAVDGDRTTRWGSAEHAPQASTFSVDLQGEYTISTITLYFDSGAFPVDFKLQYSMGNDQWSDIKNVTGNNSPSQTYIFAPVNAKYVRVVSSKTTNSSWGYSIWEFEVYGKEPQAEKTPAEVAAEITALKSPAKGAAKITLPSVDGYDIAIKSSSNTGVIGLDGSITLPEDDTDVKLVLTVSKNGVTAETQELTVTVPGVGEPQPSIDKTELLAKLKEARAIKVEGYTADSYKNFTDAIAAAQTVANNQAATQTQVNDSLADLQTAIDALETVTGETDRSALQTLYDANKGRQKSRYTDSSWLAFTTALSNAKSVLDNADAEQPEIDVARSNLAAAVSGLKKRPSSSGGSSSGKTPNAPVIPTTTSTITTTTNPAGGTVANVTTKPDAAPVVTGGQSSVTVTVPADAASIIASATAEKTAEVKIAAPTASLIEQLQNSTVKNVDVTIQVPSAVAGNTNVNAKVSITAEQAVLQAAKDAQKSVTLKVTDSQTGNEIYSWSFNGSNLKNSITPVHSIDLVLSVTPVKNDAQASAVVAGNTADQSVSGLVVKFGNNGLLPAPATVRVYVGNQEGCTPNSKIYLYYFNTTTNVLEQLPQSEYTVDAQGYVTFSIAHCSSYVVLPKNAANPYPVKSDTTYPVGVKNGKTYTFGITVSGNTVPSLTIGNSDVFVSTVKRQGDKYYVTVKAVGTPGAITALYSTLPGQKPTALCYLAVIK